MAYITVSPNPVPVEDPATGAYPHGVWDIQDEPGELRSAEVVVSINGAPSVPFMGPGVFGRFVYPVTVPNSYEFILRDAVSKSEIARVEVQTVKRHAGIVTPYSSGLSTEAAEKILVAIGRDGQVEFRDPETTTR